MPGMNYKTKQRIVIMTDVVMGNSIFSQFSRSIGVYISLAHLISTITYKIRKNENQRYASGVIFKRSSTYKTSK